MTPLWDRLGELTMPTTVVAGADDAKFVALAERLAAALPARLMSGTPLPTLRLARFGDASGVRGAALLGRRAAAGANV